MNTHFVSVITPTYKRHEHIPVVIEMFNKQDYPNDKMELIIYDDSPTPMDCLPKQSNIFYVHTPRHISLQQKRNALNCMAKGDIIVAFDNDDYYPPHSGFTCSNYFN